MGKESVGQGNVTVLSPFTSSRTFSGYLEILYGT